MVEGIRVDIGGRSAHEEALLEIQKDLLPRECSPGTPASIAASNIAALSYHMNALGLKKAKEKLLVNKSNFNELKGQVIEEIVKRLNDSERRRYEIAKQQLDMFSGGFEDATGQA